MTRCIRRSNQECEVHWVGNCGAGVSIVGARKCRETAYHAQVNHSSRTLRSWSDDASWLIYLKVVSIDREADSFSWTETHVNFLPSELIEVSTALYRHNSMISAYSAFRSY